MKKSLSFLLLGVCLTLGGLVFADTFDNALVWMQQQAITSATSKDTYKPDSTVTRQSAAKFMVQFAKAMKKKMTNYTYSNKQCAFTDVDKGNALKSDIQMACKLGYLIGKNKKFTPNGTFTIAQAVATAMRIVEGKKKENVTPWYKNYFDAANKKGYLKNIDVTDPSKPITRGNLGILLYTIANPKASTGTVSLPPVTPPSTGTVVATGTVVNTGTVNSGALLSSGSAVDSGSLLGSGTNLSGSVMGTGVSADSGSLSSGIILQ